MNRTQQQSSLPISEDFTAPITLPRMPGFAEAPYQMLAGKLTRLLARNVATKKLTMRNPRPLVSFTFDDAAATACTTGAALLEQFHARGTFYISGGKCGKPSPTGRLATIEQLKALHANGHEIACHTFSHMPVVGISRQALASDLDRNRFFLQSILGQIPIGNFAYPYGDRFAAGPREFAFAKAAGFKTAVTTRPGMMFPENADYPTALPRVSLNGNYQDERLLAVLTSGAATAMWNGFRRVNAA